MARSERDTLVCVGGFFHVRVFWVDRKLDHGCQYLVADFSRTFMG